jgi:outer membrane protein TolC
MKRVRFRVLLRCLAAVACLEGLVFVSYASAQVGAAPAPPPQATQLPLSGRSAQSGGVVATEAPVPSATTSVNTLNPTISISGPYTGSANSAVRFPFSGELSLMDAIRRGVEYNLGTVGTTESLLELRAQAGAARSALLPNFSGDAEDTEETVNLRSFGINFNVPGFVLPTVVGPFNVLDIRGRVSENVADLTLIDDYRAARETVRAGQFSVKDARNLVVLAVAGTYLQVIAARARVQSDRTQLETANALYQRTTKQLHFGRATQLDVNRSQIEVLVDQERLSTTEDDLAKQKINLARLTGLPPNPAYQLSDEIPYEAVPQIGLEDAIKQALEQRPDLEAARAQVTAAEQALTAARAERYPSLSASADYGDTGVPSSTLAPTYTVSVTLNVPIWNGGRTNADIEQAEAAVSQRRAELEDTQSQIESEVRSAFLDLQAASSQVQVAHENIGLLEETLKQTRERFETGVSENVDVVQSQESLASANLDYINSVFAYNLAKLNLARALGDLPDKIAEFLPVQLKRQP